MPKQWENTVAYQLFKGEVSKLSNHRFVYTKEENPKAFEDIFFKAKQKIVEGWSNIRLIIYELNRKTVLKVKTGVRLSESTELGENITQGSIGGALMITFNLDYIVNNHFQKKSATAI